MQTFSAVPMKNVNNYKNTVAKDLAKTILPSLDNLERAYLP